MLHRNVTNKRPYCRRQFRRCGRFCYIRKGEG
nr:MAG TPA: hypothetical protein [Caudoviricetes sp.]